MRCSRIAVAAATAAFSLAGPAVATTCSPDFGPLTCPTRADIGSTAGSVSHCGQFWMSGTWYCTIDWNVAFSGTATTPGVAVFSWNDSPSDRCDWLAGGCTKATVFQDVSIIFVNGCADAQLVSSPKVSVTATSTFGQATETEYPTLAVPNPDPTC